MFGFSIRILQSPSRLTVVDPISYWYVIVAGLVTIYPLWLFLTPKYFSKRKAIIWAILVLGAMAFASVTRLTLDRTSQTAIFEQFFFFHWSRETMPIARIDHAAVRTGSTTSQLELQYTDGSIALFSALNQMSGKDQAAYAINQFLGR